MIEAIQNTIHIDEGLIHQMSGTDIPQNLTFTNSSFTRHLIFFSGLNAMLRRIDLTCSVVAPAAVGEIMTRTSLIASAIFLAAWNVISVFIEFYLLWKIYYTVPQLQVPKRKDKATKESTLDDKGRGFTNQALEIEGNIHDQKNRVEVNGNELKDENNAEISEQNSCQRKFRMQNIWKQVKKGLHAWKLYFKQDTVFAGLALACLYMTVLGFDSITVGKLLASSSLRFSPFGEDA